MTRAALSGALSFDGSARRPASHAAILVVDDNASKRTAIKAALAPLGHRIVEAGSGIDALRCVMAEDFAVILLDVQMPDMNGFETAALIRRRLQSEMTPILFITAFSSDEIDVDDHYASGAVDFIFAPIPPSELRSKVSFFAHMFLDAERLAVKAREVKAAVAQLQLLTDTAPIGIFQTDNENRYTYTNPRWSEITGVSAEDAVGREWDSIVGAGGNAQVALALLDGAPSQPFELCGFDSPRMGVVMSQSLPDVGGGQVGWVGTLADVTVEAKAEQALSEARDAALSATLMQRNLAASVSHELRTPTASIIGYIEELLQSETLDVEDRMLLDVVKRNAERLNRLIDDLMVLDELESGAPTIHQEVTPIGPIVAHVVEGLAGAAQDAGVQLHTEHDPGAGPALADPARLEQVLTSLVSNALKFTPRGGTISVVVRPNDEMIEIDVTDTGIGIDPADFDKIFQRFYRTARATDNAIPGSGLGLSIAKGMVEAQGGAIVVSSAVGEGSTFTVTVPTAGLVLSR